MARIIGVGLRHIGPDSRNETPAAVGKNQEKMELTLSMCLLQDLQGASFERMGPTGNGDRLGKVFEMGSVSCFPLIESATPI